VQRVHKRRLLELGLLVMTCGCLSTRSSAQEAPNPVDFRPFSDARFWIVKEPLVYRVGVSKDSVVVPRGFVTDFASIPPALQSLIQKNSENLLPAVVHDFLYWTQTCTRAESDQLLKLAMIENRVSSTQQKAIYGAVRAAGIFAWASNREERDRAMVRILPEQWINVPRLVDWREYQKQLKLKGIADGPQIPIDKGFCGRGDMTDSAALRDP
jgi:hypothetical protein